MANMAASLIRHSRITTTLAKAKALRPFIEKNITLAKRASETDNAAKSLHCRRLAISKIRDKDAVKLLFEERVSAFLERKGGYTRIYKLGKRVGDAAEMAIIEFIAADDEGYPKRSKKKAAKSIKGKKAAPKAKEIAVEVEQQTEEAVVEEAPKKAEEVKPAPKKAATAKPPSEASTEKKVAPAKKSIATEMPKADAAVKKTAPAKPKSEDKKDAQSALIRDILNVTVIVLSWRVN